MMHGVTISFQLHHMQTDDSLPKFTSVFASHKNRNNYAVCQLSSHYSSLSDE